MGDDAELIKIVEHVATVGSQDRRVCWSEPSALEGVALIGLGATVRFKRWHELSIVAAGEQFFEYSNCHSGTGLLNAD